MALFSLIGLSLIIISGGAVRLTQSGLGCPTWPNCQGSHLVASFSLHPMIEFTNRVITIFLTVAVMVATAGAFFRRPFRKDLAWLAVGMVFGLIGQIILGGITVLEKLAPPFVMAHFILSLICVLDAIVLYYRASSGTQPSRPLVGKEVIWLSRLMLAVLSFVLLIGTAVTGSGPHSGSPLAVRLPFALRDVAQLHADGVMFLIGLTLAMLFLLHQGSVVDVIAKRGRSLLWLMLIQGFIGYTQYFSNLPALLVGFHIAGATALWIAMLWFNLTLFDRGALETKAPEATMNQSVHAV
ncbi:MAG: COX15/CtaA family protein [Actinomycetota bacterium]|nr:COX15/CtaA family protein [Actinomycetota bacterium]